MLARHSFLATITLQFISKNLVKSGSDLIVLNNLTMWLQSKKCYISLLRSEIPSGMCAELRTVAASNNRDHPVRSLYYCLFAPHT